MWNITSCHWHEGIVVKLTQPQSKADGVPVILWSGIDWIHHMQELLATASCPETLAVFEVAILIVPLSVRVSGLLMARLEDFGSNV